jgi:hypothetical protein
LSSCVQAQIMDSDEDESKGPIHSEAETPQNSSSEEESPKQGSDEELIVTDGEISEGEAAPAVLTPDDFELVALYGFSAKCPKTARLEFNPKSRREKGDLVFHFDQGVKIFVSWGRLEDARKRYPTAAAQASDSIKRSIKSTQAKLDGTPETKNLNINGHDAVYTRARMLVNRGAFPFGSRPVAQDAYAMHVQCEDSERYYVVYAFARPEVTEQVAKIFEPIMSSLKCHSS